MGYGSHLNLYLIQKRGVYEKGEIARNPPLKECGGNTHRLANQFFFRTQKNFEYKYGAGFRDKNSENLDHNIFEVNEDCETNERRNVIGIIAIRGEEIFTSGKEMFIEYITQRIQEELGVGSYGDNDILFSGVGNFKEEE